MSQPKGTRKARTHKVWPDTALVNAAVDKSGMQTASMATSRTFEEPVGEPTSSVATFAEKKKRVPVGLRDPMALSKDLDPNFNYRFVRNTPGRVDKFIEGGYEMVTGDARIGDPNIAKASNMGSAFSIASGDNADRVFLMRIPKEYYDEDHAAKQAKINEVEEQLKQKPKEQGLQGEIKLNR
jgi:hypothetical protein